jgi:hypothetical protein
MKLDRKIAAVIIADLVIYLLIAVFIITGAHRRYYDIFITIIVIVAFISILEVVFFFLSNKKKNIELLKKLKKITGIDSKISITNDSIYFDYDGVKFQCRYLPEENCDRYILRAFLPRPLNFGIVGIPKFATAFPRFSHLNYIGEIVSADRFLEMDFITLDRDLASQVLKDEKVLKLIEDILQECKSKREVVSINERVIELYINSLANVGKNRLSKMAELAKELSKYSDLKGQKKFQLAFIAEVSIIILTALLAFVFIISLIRQ